MDFKKKVWLQNEVAFAETSDFSDPQITLEETNKQTHKQHSTYVKNQYLLHQLLKSQWHQAVHTQLVLNDFCPV